MNRLIAREHVYRDVAVRLMLEIADMQRFPELERHEDSAHLIRQAQDAVAELKRHTKAYGQLIVERECLEAERAAYSQQAEMQRRFANELDDLKRAGPSCPIAKSTTLQ